MWTEASIAKALESGEIDKATADAHFADIAKAEAIEKDSPGLIERIIKAVAGSKPADGDDDEKNKPPKVEKSEPAPASAAPVVPTLAAIIKSDNTIDEDLLAKADAAVRPLLKEAAEREIVLRKQVAEATQVANEERAIRKAKEFTDTASGLSNLGVSADELGGILMSADKALEKAEYDKLFGVLKAADAKIAEGALFAEMGSATAEEGSPEDQLNKMAENLVQKDTTGMTAEQAFTKAIQTDKGRALYAQMNQN